MTHVGGRDSSRPLQQTTIKTINNNEKDICHPPSTQVVRLELTSSILAGSTSVKISDDSATEPACAKKGFFDDDESLEE